MSKGLSLEQFKQQLDTDAQKRNRTQESTIREQSHIISKLRDEVKQKDSEIYSLKAKLMFGELVTGRLIAQERLKKALQEDKHND